MVFLILATAVALLGFGFARSAGPETVASLNRFGNAAGILSRFLTAFDAIRLVATWSSAGSHGPGPLTVPVPVMSAQQMKVTPPSSAAAPVRPANQTPASEPLGWPDPYANDPVGRDLGLPPKVDTSKPDFVVGGGYRR